MESKIQIDIDNSGLPQIRIDYRLTDDLRDRLIGRFIDRMGIPADRNGFWAYCRLGHETQSIKDGVHDGRVVFVEPMNKEVLDLHMPEIENMFGGRERMTEREALQIVNHLCVNALPHDIYKKWHDEMFKDTVKRTALPLSNDPSAPPPKE